MENPGIVDAAFMSALGTMVELAQSKQKNPAYVVLSACYAGLKMQQQEIERLQLIVDEFEIKEANRIQRKNEMAR